MTNPVTNNANIAADENEVNRILATGDFKLSEAFAAAMNYAKQYNQAQAAANHNQAGHGQAKPAKPNNQSGSESIASLHGLPKDFRSQLAFLAILRDKKLPFDTSPEALHKALTRVNGATDRNINTDNLIEYNANIIKGKDGVHINQLPEEYMSYLQITINTIAKNDRYNGFVDPELKRKLASIEVVVDGVAGPKTREALVALGVLRKDGGIIEGALEKLDEKYIRDTMKHYAPKPQQQRAEASKPQNIAQAQYSVVPDNQPKAGEAVTPSDAPVATLPKVGSLNK